MMLFCFSEIAKGVFGSEDAPPSTTKPKVTPMLKYMVPQEESSTRTTGHKNNGKAWKKKNFFF